MVSLFLLIREHIADMLRREALSRNDEDIQNGQFHEDSRTSHSGVSEHRLMRLTLASEQRLMRPTLASEHRLTRPTLASEHRLVQPHTHEPQGQPLPHGKHEPASASWQARAY